MALGRVGEVAQEVHSEQAIDIVMAEVEYVDWKLVLRAQLTPDHLLGRVISTARVVTFGLQPLSLFLAGVLLDLAGGAATLWMLGGASLAASAAFWLLGGARRTLADPPQHQHRVTP